ncbi:cilia- and flagella-associated protein 45 isoform X1 [Clinocottus analis]|uniref:cilia- and flagella-associated protein 45 isoform X1 n=2 Tax=Clinocottus analis TaxID=304258 RepID=UPI0035BF3AE6
MMRGSGNSKSRSSAYTRGYRRLAPTSQVDESLFGSPNPLDKHENSASKAPKNPSMNNQEGETVQIVTKDLIRSLRIPLKDPSGESLILPLAEFQRITSNTKVLTKEELQALKEARQKKKEEEITAAEERKRKIHEADLSRKENQALTELEIEARDRAQRLLQRANALKMEEEDEIKKLNNLIMAAQCQATRDAQIDEKKQIQAEMSEEEKRLDAMMEVERRKALETVEQIDELRKQQRIGGMQNICKQIQQHLNDKQMQDVMKEQEKVQTREKREKMKQEDFMAIEKKREEQQHLHEEVMRINTETMRAKEQRREEEKMADMRNMEYMRKKMKREAEFEAEQRRIKKEKELEIARLRAQQEKAKDYKAEQDDLRARRNQEAADREWRRKEKELNAKKAQEKAMLMEAREEQIHCKEQQLSMEAGREKAEFERVLKVQKEEIARQEELEKKQQQRARNHADAIRNQVKEQMLSAEAKRRDRLKEVSQLIEEARQRRVRLEEIKEKKLKELRATGVSERYCSEVERKAQL